VDIDHGHLRLEGRHTYYLVKVTRDEWFLIVDTAGGAPPRREDLYPDFLAFQFVLGRAIKLESFLGVDTAGEVVAMVGGVHGRDQGEDAQVTPPVPTAWSTNAIWAAPFFSAISKTYAANELETAKNPKKNLRLYIALSGYVESLAEAHVEGRALRLHVALEAFAYWVLRFLRGPQEETATEAWYGWVAEREADIRKFAPSREEPLAAGEENDAANALVNKVRNAIFPASMQSVPAAYADYGITLKSKMKRGLSKVRGKLVHTGILFEAPQEKIEKYLEPIDIVRTLLVGLIAKVVGYEGEIIGWKKERHQDHEVAPSDWWPTSEACRAEALVDYAADAGDMPGYLRYLELKAAPVLAEK
jgi:hypothetical protein